MPRKLTKQEEQAIRLCHHEFQHLPRRAAAGMMAMTGSRLNYILKTARQKAPQLFPILTPKQFAVYKLAVIKGYYRMDIASIMKLSLKQVDAVIQQLRNKGYYTIHKQILRYQNYMDDEVVEKF